MKQLYVLKDKYSNYLLNKKASGFIVDPGIIYPSYKSMDEFIDVEKLKALDESIMQYIRKYIEESKLAEDKFYLGPVTSKALSNKTSGARYIRLAESPEQDVKFANSYQFIGSPKKWKNSHHAEQLPELMAFIKEMPFKATGRVTLIFDTGGHAVAPHRDHGYPKYCHEFIWLRTNLRKKFYMAKGDKRVDVTSYTAWFDSVNQFHGADAVDELNFSIRIDGIFSDELRKLIPKPNNYNLASTPALWATKTDLR